MNLSVERILDLDEDEPKTMDSPRKVKLRRRTRNQIGRLSRKVKVKEETRVYFTRYLFYDKNPLNSLQNSDEERISFNPRVTSAKKDFHPNVFVIHLKICMFLSPLSC